MGDSLTIIADVLQDAVMDTLYLIPFLFVTYLAMEWIEHRSSSKFQEAIQRTGVIGPAVGAVLGVVPQCGFSAASSTLYAGRVITLGTLIAVFLSTSDEMLPIFVAEQVPVETIGAILLTKIAVGMIAGFVIDAILRIRNLQNDKMCIHELCVREGCDCGDIDEELRCLEGKGVIRRVTENGELCEECTDDGLRSCDGGACSCDDDFKRDGCRATQASKSAAQADVAEGESNACDMHVSTDDASHSARHHSIVRSAIYHTVKVSLFVFIIVLAINFVMAAIGEDALAGILGGSPTAAVFVSALVGLIPNCAASVAIAQLYVDGLLGSGAMISGLLSAAGVGLLVLFRTNRKVRDNLIIVIALWTIASISGLVINGLGIVF